MFIKIPEKLMKKSKNAAALLIGAALLLTAVLPACQPGQANTSAPTRLTLADYANVLDIASALPKSFGQMDASVLGLSNEQLGLGEKWSEVEAFFSRDPFQIIYATYNIVDSPTGRVLADATLKDETPVKVEIQSGIMQAAAAAGLKQSPIDVKMSSPSIGDLALLGEGVMATEAGNFGCDILKFKVNIVYFNVFSVYNPARLVETPKAAEAIIERLKPYMQ
jgi:hypothetical protein